MGGGSLINAIVINAKIEKIKKGLKSGHTNTLKALEILNVLSFFASPKIIVHNSGCFEKHYHVCTHYICKCVCLHIDFIVEHVMIESDKLFINDTAEELI
jgi:hypothetical protein